MNAHSLAVLSYEEVRARLADFTSTEYGRCRLLSLLPSTERRIADYRLDLFEDLSRFLVSGRFPEFACDDIRSSLDKLRAEDAVLSRVELFRVCRTLRGIMSLRGAFGPETPPHGILAALAGSVRPLPALMSAFYGVFDEAGEIQDGASEELRRIRAVIREVRQRLKRHAEARARQMEDAEVFLWDNRTVLLVRGEVRRGLRGIVHASSSSGLSVYFEPDDFVGENNELAGLVSGEEEEILRILSRLSALTAEGAPDILFDMEKAAELDAAAASWRWSSSENAVRPVFDDGRMEILQARHPLIRGCVPVDIRLSAPGRLLVISGPNTGGKSAALKTAGLLAALAMTGWPVPASLCRLRFFDGIFVDLGDEQSLEKALSTFSAHLVNVRTLLEGVTERSLVLLDEPGAGTEPESGEAFAEVLLKEIAGRACLAVITTHFKRVKLLALSDARFRNAAVDFDPATGEPRYSLLYDVPGESRPLDAMRRTGFPSDFLERVSSAMDPEREKLSSVIAGLADEKRRWEESRRTCERRIAETAAMEASANRRKEDYEVRERTLKKEFRKQVKEFLSAARQKFEALVREMIESGRPKDFTGRGRAFFDELEKELGPVPATAPAQNDFAIGGKVLVRGKHEGLLESVREGKAIVQTEIGRVTVSVTDISVCAEEKPGSAVHVASPPVRSAPGSGGGSKTELNLIGLRREDAAGRLLDFFDAALLSGVPFVRIVHGKGSGALREMTRSFFEERKKSGEIRSYAPAPAEAGGEGCTIAEI